MKTNYIILSILFLFLLESCQKTITIKLPTHEPVAVVRCNIEEGDSVLTVWVAETVGILDTQYIGEYAYQEFDSLKYAESNWVPDATVSIYENGNLLAVLTPVPHLRVYRAYLPQALQCSGKSFELQVTAPGLPEATATLNFPVEPQFGDLVYQPLAGRDTDGFAMDIVKFKLQDPAGQGNYYKVQVWSEIIDTAQFDQSNRFPNYLVSSNPILEADDNGLVISDIGIDGQNYEVSFLCYPLDSSFSRNTLEVIGIDRATYFYRKSLNDYNGAVGNPFAEPVIIYSNVNNGRGLFSGSFRKKIPLF